MDDGMIITGVVGGIVLIILAISAPFVYLEMHETPIEKCDEICVPLVGAEEFECKIACIDAMENIGCPN